MIPSLLQIPSAVSDSKLHSVLPNNGKGDFTFDRSTGATRINKDGLIEEVGYFSSELVQNGNFSELGSELIVNGDFATTDNWNAQTGWSINNGKAVADLASNRYIQQVYTGGALTSGKTYKIVFTVSDYITGNLKAQLAGGGSTQDLATINANGTYTRYAVATNNATGLRFKGISSGGGFTGKIDNVSVKQVDPNDRWTLDSNWAYGSNKVIGSATTSEIQQDVDLPSGKVYKTTFTIEDYVSGDVRIRFRGGTTVNGTNRSGNGTYTEILTSTGHTNVKIDGGTSFTGSVTNISVVEVQGDRPRLSYDITNGVVEDKPHLLLEPSSTNLITFSEDLTNGWLQSSVDITSNIIIAPDGTMTADLITPQTNNNFHYVRSNNGGDLSASGYNMSFFAKANGYNFVRVFNNIIGVGVDIDIVNEVVSNKSVEIGDVSIKNYGEWKKIEVQYIGSRTFSYLAIQPMPTAGLTTFSGNGFSGVYVWGAQIEAQSYATSYIPTAGTTITRAAETCNNSKPSVNSTEGVLYAEIAALTSAAGLKQFALTDGTNANNVKFSFRSTAEQISVSLRSNNTDVSNLIKSDATTTTNFFKVAIKYKLNDVAVFLNGTEILTDTSVTMPTGLNTLTFDRGDGSNKFEGKVKGLAVYNEALSESQLMQLTGVTASSIYSNFVTRTASFTVEALNEVKKVIDNL